MEARSKYPPHSPLDPVQGKQEHFPPLTRWQKVFVPGRFFSGIAEHGGEIFMPSCQKSVTIAAYCRFRMTMIDNKSQFFQYFYAKYLLFYDKQIVSLTIFAKSLAKPIACIYNKEVIGGDHHHVRYGTGPLLH